MKPEDWQAYQAGRNPGQPHPGVGGYGPPPGYPPPPPYPPPAAPPKARRGMGWPLAILLLGLGLIGGCCYSFNTFLDKAAGPLETSISEPGVGVLVMEDEIFGSIWATDIIERFKNNPNIKSVVVRINSPGGAVAPSQEIYQAVKSLNKPVVVSMGSVAASGGLYVAAAGDLIMANPGTITGSIGVIMQSVEVEGTMEKIGVKTLTIKSGDFKDMGSPFRAMRPDERELLQAMVMDVYEQFIADLVESQKGRGKRGLAEEDIRKMADGRIFTGAEALKLGLIDELGGRWPKWRTAAARPRSWWTGPPKGP
ncbi:signal peptide peptidase SppA [Deltaproteobacteria bacterium OttesenSCG-928-M10]|nr:signal peptide peptidase SppA [Deltaproteobacteria bacterium OttesenSCG-928-M10]